MICENRERLRAELNRLGVNCDRLVIGFTGGQIILSGELKTFHQVQLAHLGARNVFPDHEVVLNLSVNDETKNQTDATANPEETELHSLRNELNRYIVGVQVMVASLQMGDVDDAIDVGETLIESHSTRSQASLPSIRGHRLLVIEDNVNESNLLCGLLRKAGAMVTQAHDAVTAFRLIGAGFVPEIVLLDMHLPNLNGKQIADQIRALESCDGIGLVAVSGTDPTELGLQVKDGELDAWLPKPLNVERLIQTLESFLRRTSSEAT